MKQLQGLFYTSLASLMLIAGTVVKVTKPTWFDFFLLVAVVLVFIAFGAGISLLITLNQKLDVIMRLLVATLKDQGIEVIKSHEQPTTNTVEGG